MSGKVSVYRFYKWGHMKNKIRREAVHVVVLIKAKICTY